jgi:hypothetical protein
VDRAPPLIGRLGIRANVAEALWGVNSTLAVHTPRKCLRDEDSRVDRNAIAGLHMLGEPSVNWRSRQLTKDSRPASRRTAAWLIGRLDIREFEPLLRGLLAAPNQGVQQSAESALAGMRWPAWGRIGPESSAEVGRETGLTRLMIADTPDVPAKEGKQTATPPDAVTAPPYTPAAEPYRPLGQDSNAPSPPSGLTAIT